MPNELHVELERHLKAGRKSFRVRLAIRTGLDHLREAGNRLTSEAAPQTIAIYGWLGPIGSSISRVKAASLIESLKSNGRSKMDICTRKKTWLICEEFCFSRILAVVYEV